MKSQFKFAESRKSKMSEGYLLNELKKCDLQLKNYILFELPET